MDSFHPNLAQLEAARRRAARRLEKDLFWPWGVVAALGLGGLWWWLGG